MLILIACLGLQSKHGNADCQTLTAIHCKANKFLHRKIANVKVAAFRKKSNSCFQSRFTKINSTLNFLPKEMLSHLLISDLLIGFITSFKCKINN